MLKPSAKTSCIIFFSLPDYLGIGFKENNRVCKPQRARLKSHSGRSDGCSAEGVVAFSPQVARRTSSNDNEELMRRMGFSGVGDRSDFALPH